MTNTELQEKITYLEAKLAEVKEMAEAMKNRDDGVFKPEYEQKYWYISGSEEAYARWWRNHQLDKTRYEIGNCFPTRQAAEDVVRVLKLIQKARESQDGYVPDWENLEQNKYSLYFDMGEVCIIECSSQNLTPIFGYWEDESACQKFLHENREEILWFFKEYRR